MTSKPSAHKVYVRASQFAVFVIFFGVWELLAKANVLNPEFTSEPSAIFPALWNGVFSGNLVELLGATLYETFVGFIIAALLGLIIGYLMAEFTTFNEISRPFMDAMNSVPRIALAPLFVLWFGLGPLSRIVLVITLSFFIVAFNTYAGLQSVNRDHLLLARVLNANRWVKFKVFVFPSAVPTIFAGLELALTYAFLGAVVGEMLAGNTGLGGYLSLSIGTFDTANFFAALILLIIAALVVYGAVHRLRRHLLRWKEIELHGTR